MAHFAIYSHLFRSAARHFCCNLKVSYTTWQTNIVSECLGFLWVNMDVFIAEAVPYFHYIHPNIW